jgi:hypothetical protein
MQPMIVAASPFTPNTFVVTFNDFILCAPEIEGGRPVEWYDAQGAQWMVNAILEEGLCEFQWLSEETCRDRLPDSDSK